MSLLFPANPTHDMIFELGRGILYRYDASIKSWIKIASSNVLLPLATSAADGAMSATDLQKLNRLVIPPPNSTIVGNNCAGAFTKGFIGLYGDDRFITVNGNVNITNLDATGEQIGGEYPFNIHQHTYGFDFTLNIPHLITELKKRGQFIAIGPTGPQGIKGETGDPGEDEIISGPQGEQGDQGLAPPCELESQPEPIQANAKRGLKTALTAVTAIINAEDPTKYVLQFDRQVVGKADATTGLFNMKQQKSPWVLAVQSIVGTPQDVYYIDVDIIINAIRSKYLEEVSRLKKGYEDIVEFWVQTMSDLFDEQKAALCCALENCISKTKSTQLRQHMESVAATALPRGIVIHENGEGGGKIEMSGTSLWPSDYKETCESPPRPVKCGDTASYSGNPKFPRTTTIRLGAGTGDITFDYNANSIPAKFVVTYGGKVVIDTGYRGDSSKQAALDAELTARGVPTEAIQGSGSGSATFTKGSSDTATVDVYGPLVGTTWSCSCSCPIQSESCDTRIKYSGYQNFPWTKNIQLGAGTGTITLDYDMQGIPDKILIYYDGKKVIDTGYRGLSVKQKELDDELKRRGVTPEPIVGGPTGTASFVKATATTYAVAEVYGPLIGTYWEFTLSCPTIASSVSPMALEVDPLLNVSSNNAAQIALDKGKYIATLRSFGTQIAGKHFADLVITYNSGNKRKQVRFLNKGKFDSLVAAKSAYEGLTLSFEHDGGDVGAFFHMIPIANVSGSILLDIVADGAINPVVELEQVDEPAIESVDREFSCKMPRRHLEWYKRSWDTGNCCGVIVNVAGQDYIVVKKTIGNDLLCGGGESESTACIAEFAELGHPAFAWPTLDGEHFVPITSDVTFKYDKDLNDIVLNAIKNHKYDGVRGSVTGYRHLAYQFSAILFPMG